MDGAGYLKIFFRISLPQLRPALASLGIITFTQTWNYYFQARVLLEPQNAMTLPIAMDLLRGYLGSGNLALVMAAMSMSVLPVILLVPAGAEDGDRRHRAQRNQNLRGAYGRNRPKAAKPGSIPVLSIAASDGNTSPFRSAASARAACR